MNDVKNQVEKVRPLEACHRYLPLTRMRGGASRLTD